ncbi:DEAD/DEAH box helicase [Flavobacterium sp. TAB 87]|uniref:DEAD/DEAH box helicase n=1 Tax=Flavobacterium sp. TAB 87 TaxID=1729581 RepID=UPI00076C10E3|nr:DEAD/DEAH box helicase [Flavobacterium sp. TAB 87]KVV16182.1 ski2-like helicase [Flavobacterium sp. TAB 87]
MINQSKREEVIKLLDQPDNEVKIEDLFLFDLSPYYDEKKDNSFFSKQLEFILEKNLLNHNSTRISFTAEQKKIYDEISLNKRVLLSAPTSFGKTMLVKEYIYNEQPNKIVFLVPTNSLADELADDFNKIFKDLGYTIFDTIKNESKIDDKSIFIGTQEKYSQIYNGYTSGIDLFIIDEAYKLSDKIESSREVILNRTFIDTLTKANKVVLLLPLVNEINGLDNLNFKILKSDFAPVAKNFISLEDFDTKLLHAISKSDESNLVYFNSPPEAESFFLDKIKDRPNEFHLSNDWIKRVETDFHPEWIPIKALKKGIGIHYGPMPKFIQKKVIDLFNDSKIRTLLATSSVIEGVNTPTKNIYITTSNKILGDKNIIKFKNLIGRAGRLGIHKVGNVYYKNIHEHNFIKANIPYEDIHLNFIITNQTEIIEINREDEYKSAYTTDGVQNDSEDSKKVSQEKTKDYLKDSNHGKVPFEKISELLNNYGFTIKQFKDLIEFVKKPNTNLFGVLSKLKSLDAPNNNNNSINIILNSNYQTIPDIVHKLSIDKNFSKYESSKLVSIVIKMIYSVIPHKIIPALEFIIELDNLYQSRNKKRFISSSIKEEANYKRVLFFNKFLGEKNTNIVESKKIMTKLFEYGIPYLRVKEHLITISDRIPENFSIHDIKKIIYENESMTDLRIYFE